MRPRLALLEPAAADFVRRVNRSRRALRHFLPRPRLASFLEGRSFRDRGLLFPNGFAFSFAHDCFSRMIAAKNQARLPAGNRRRVANDSIAPSAVHVARKKAHSSVKLWNLKT